MVCALKLFLSLVIDVLKIPFRRRSGIYTHISGAGEVLIYTYLAPERPEKPEKYLYTSLSWNCVDEDQNNIERLVMSYLIQKVFAP